MATEERHVRMASSLRASVISVAVVVMVLVLAACVPGESREQGSLLVIASAGPVCPVETNPPDPNCAPRPVANAPIVVAEPDGDVVADGETGADGRLTLTLPVGDYVVSAGPLEGLTGTPAPALVTVVSDIEIEVAIAYDTGIR
jgi:hypothetical protein